MSPEEVKKQKFQYLDKAFHEDVAFYKQVLDRMASS